MSDFPTGSEALHITSSTPLDGNTPSSSPQSSKWSYEATVAEIESIINRIEMGELELAEVFDQFATAIERLRQCETFLNQQQQQMDLMIETLLDEPEAF
ncbi:exodeoxyribonuclease VII small subunit [Oculatella sp. LEGE 06141]|uniref:exodeoxyribonuclease VII small subunit n=1 Tax=Oculatella sp. LEGE 06141 TaxID=1828648 RepID=UPI00187E9396|nr:exodeoxyribonuclease VII small subunit [Oculatella sp. LEGE 06141]MBE9178270.1 exodeoxyribonuclease VII small subunit [Oculatella sp. LEGE 06141]